MEIQVKCKVSEKHIAGIRKYAKLVEKTDQHEIYKLLTVTAVIEGEIATITMSGKDPEKTKQKLLAITSKFGIEVVQCDV